MVAGCALAGAVLIAINAGEARASDIDPPSSTASAWGSSAAMAARRINAGPVNNVAADTTTQATQYASSVVDLGNGSLVTVFVDSGSYDGTVGGGNDHLIGYATSANGGASWTDRGRLPDSALGDRGPATLAFDSLNKIVYLAAPAFLFNQVNVYRSTNNGVTFAPARNASPASPAGSRDPASRSTISRAPGARTSTPAGIAR